MKNYYSFTKLRSVICFKSFIMDLYYLNTRKIEYSLFTLLCSSIKKPKGYEINKTSDI